MIAAARWSRRIDSAANRGLERTYPLVRLARLRLGALARVATTLLVPPLRWLGACLGGVLARLRGMLQWLGRPLLARFFGLLALLDRGARRGLALSARGATAASAVLTPRRASAVALVAAGAFLIAAQFADYRAVEVGQPGYAGLPDLAQPPLVDVRTAGEAHSYLLAPVGGLAILLGLAGIRRERPRLGLAAAALGLLAIAVILLVDLPRGLDEGVQSSRFAGAAAVLQNGFWAELAAAAGLLLCGLLYYARPCLIRISSSGRAASARRRRPRRRASSRARVARSA